MKNIFHFRFSAKIAGAVLIASCCFGSCKKSGGSENSVRGSLQYEFEGQKYNGLDGNWAPLYDGTKVYGISITRYDLFGGEIVFNKPGCAYLNPHNAELAEDPGCILSYTDGKPIDSSRVYLYQSGVFNVNTSNRKQIQKHDPFTGEYYYVDECDVHGNFNVTLVNNKGDIIEIKNGVLNGKFQFQ